MQDILLNKPEGLLLNAKARKVGQEQTRTLILEGEQVVQEYRLRQAKTEGKGQDYAFSDSHFEIRTIQHKIDRPERVVGSSATCRVETEQQQVQPQSRQPGLQVNLHDSQRERVATNSQLLMSVSNKEMKI